MFLFLTQKLDFSTEKMSNLFTIHKLVDEK